MSKLDLTPGTEIPPFVRHQDLHNWNRYAAVNDEFVPIHMDDEAGKAAGFSGAIGMGNLACTYLHNVLRDWLGDNGRIASVSVQYRQPNLRGSTLTTHARIASVEGNKVRLEMWVDDDAGRVLMNGEGVVELTGQ
jgi:acyl dehydratase